MKDEQIKRLNQEFDDMVKSQRFNRPLPLGFIVAGLSIILSIKECHKIKLCIAQEIKKIEHIYSP